MSLTAVVFVIVYIFGLVMAFAKGTHWAFYIYQLVYFFNPENRWWSSSLPTFGYSLVTSVTLLLSYLFTCKQYTTNKIIELPYFKWMVLLIFSFIIAYFFAILPAKHEKFTIEFFKMLIVVTLAYKVLDTQQKLEWALLAYMVGAAYIGYEAYIVGRDQFGRVEGIGMVDAPESNGTAAAIVPTIPLLIFYFWKGGMKLKLSTTIMGAFIVNGLILINSRGAFVGAAAGAAYFMFEMFRGKVVVKHQKLIAISLVLAGLMAVAMLVDDSFLSRMGTLTEVEDESRSGSNRHRLWLVALDMSFEYPFGTGALGFEALSPDYVPAELFIGGQKRKAVHSIWMQALSEVGWIGFISFLMIILYSYRSLLKIKARCMRDNKVYNYYLAHALLSSFVGLLVASSFINQFRVQTLYWLLLFIACFYSLIIINNPETDQKNIRR